MKYFPIINILSITLMTYWLFKDCKFKPWFRKTKSRIVDFFCNWTERINSDYELF